MTATPDPTRPAADPDVVALLAEVAERHRFQATRDQDGTLNYGWCICGRSWGTKHISKHEVHVATEQAAALAARGLPQGETVTEWGVRQPLGTFWPRPTRESAERHAAALQPLLREGETTRIERRECGPWQPVEDGGQR